MRCLYTVFVYGYILLPMAIYYFRRLYTIFDFYYFYYLLFFYYLLYTTYCIKRCILLLALSNHDFVRIQHFPAIPCICGLKARLEFLINLLTLRLFVSVVQWLLLQISSHSFENAVLSEILKC